MARKPLIEVVSSEQHGKYVNITIVPIVNACKHPISSGGRQNEEGGFITMLSADREFYSARLGAVPFE